MMKKIATLEFQNQFMSTDPYSHNIETNCNWLGFKLTFHRQLQRPKSISHGSLIVRAIRKKMQKRKHLYNKAKSTGSEET